ncbi:hypothetical protein EOL70_11030 [Leucothrix sargassi]|nr:hypothetical protein EOL70_11030 [Leucothrix sargassi]
MMGLNDWATAAVVVALSFSTVTTAFADEQSIKANISAQSLSSALSHGPWPPKAAKTDPSNRVSGNKDAITFGEELFNSPLLSGDKQMSCASCHAADKAFATGEVMASGKHQLHRDSQTLFNVKFNRWFGWSGSNDNLWAQSIRPMLSETEMNLGLENIKQVAAHATFKDAYTELFGEVDSQSDEAVLVNLGKALAAYQETLVSGQTAFDGFRDAVANKDWQQASKYPESAQRGLELFFGKGRCNFCHQGALFTNGEFHDAGVPYFIRPGVVDSGRHEGLAELKKSPFTLASDYNDDPAKAGAWAVNKVAYLHSNFGVFRVPSLRNVAKTAPYMHNGSLETLEDVVEHYNNINMERLHADGEAILQPLGLSKSEVADLVAFLESLSD